MKTVLEFLHNTCVIIVDDDTGCFIQTSDNEQRLDELFNSVLDAVNYAHRKCFVIIDIQLK